MSTIHVVPVTTSGAAAPTTPDFGPASGLVCRECGATYERQVAPVDSQRPFNREGDREEDQGGQPVARRGERERAEPVREDVARHGEVERPEHDHGQQHQLDRRGTPHADDATG